MSKPKTGQQLELFKSRKNVDQLLTAEQRQAVEIISEQSKEFCESVLEQVDQPESDSYYDCLVRSPVTALLLDLVFLIQVLDSTLNAYLVAVPQLGGIQAQKN